MLTSIKTCCRCGSEKPLDAFYNYKKSKTGKSAACKVCMQKARKESQSKRDKHHREKAARRHLVRKYGITMEERNEMLEDQGGVCAICEGGVDFVVDHCHTSGEVRGILCRTCNQGIGLLKESIKSLENAIKYLKSC